MPSLWYLIQCICSGDSINRFSVTIPFTCLCVMLEYIKLFTTGVIMWDVQIHKYNRYKAMYHFMVSEELENLELYFKRTWCKDFNLDFTVSYHLDLKDLPSHLFHLFRGIVTHNNWQSYCLDSSWTLTLNTDIWGISIISFSFHVILHVISQQLNLFSSFSSSKGEIHELEVNLDNLLSLFHGNLFKVPKLPKLGYPSDANSNKETKKVWTLQPKPS